jgi:uncharacterized membrane protein YphA (DoxX/SURF4 family)
MATVVLFVALRLALGCHFLYEGVWKITHPVEFAGEAEGFLSGARGPMAGLFYAMVPDIDGRQRLTAEGETAQWQTLCDRFVAVYPDSADHAREICQEHINAAQKYLKQNRKDIDAYFEALDRFEKSKEAGPRTAFQNKRNWDTMRKLRAEAKVWLVDLDGRKEALKAALNDLAEDRTGEAGGTHYGKDPFAWSINPFSWTRMEQIRFAITWGLTAIGVCLIIGLGTRPAALGGGLFMLFVVMSQPSWPGMVPPDPPQLGHALLVNKDFIEMIALFLLATTAAGRWGGLDYYLENYVAIPLLSRFCGKACCQKQANVGQAPRA